MRLPSTVPILLTVCGLALAGCGGSDEEDPAAATSTAESTPTTVSTATTAPTETTTATETTTPTETTTASTETAPSGGATPPTETTTTAPKDAGGDQPTIAPGTADAPATTTAGDSALAELWCDQARQGAYNDQVGDATTLVIRVSGSDATQRCELPR